MFVNLSQPISTAHAEPVPAPIFSYLESMAITIGIKDGQIARSRFPLANFFVFFASPKPVQLANPRLEALRAYAELACALFPRSVPTASLENAGFDGLQSRKLLEMIGRCEERQSQERADISHDLASRFGRSGLSSSDAPSASSKGLDR